MSADGSTTVGEEEVLRERVRTLEAELAETQRAAAAAIAAAQERAYWLDRWGVDLNALMARPGADRARSAFRRGRVVFRAGRRLRRRLGR